MQPLQGRPLLPHSGPLTRGTAERGWGAMPQNAAVGTVEAVVLEAFVAAVPGGWNVRSCRRAHRLVAVRSARR